MNKKRGTIAYSEEIVSDWFEESEEITLIRYTIKHTEPIPEHLGPDIVTYRQTDWHSVQLIPRENEEIVKIEKKVVEVVGSCLRRKK